MQIRLTVTRTQGSRQTSADVLVTAQPGAKLSSVHQALRGAAGVNAPGRLFAGLDPLEEDAPLGRPFLVDGARLWLDTPGTPATLIGSLALHVVSGPDAGGVHLLTPKDDAGGFFTDGRGGGEVPISIGRGADADIRIDDPDISRMHAELLVVEDREYQRVLVRDLGSTNGITLDGAQVGGAPVELRPGSLLRMGESSIALVVDSGGVPALPVRPDGVGAVDVGRVGWERGQVEPPQLRIDLPARPPEKGRPAARRQAMDEYEWARAEADRRIAAALTNEARIRREASPDPATLLVSAVRPDARLWERRPGDPDFLRLRLGTAALPSGITVVGGKAVQPRVPTVPVTVDVPACGVVGMVGPRPELARLARFAVAQAAGSHSPRDVEIVMIAPELLPGGPGSGASPTDGYPADGYGGGVAHAGEEHWRWTRWLPHLIPEDGQDCTRLLGVGPDQGRARLAELADRIRTRRGEGGVVAPGVTPIPDSGRAVLVVIDPIVPLAGLPELGEVLTHGPAAGVFTLCLADRPADLPPQTGAMITLGGEVNSRLRIDSPTAAPIEGAIADMVSVAWADRFARALAPLRDRREAPVDANGQTHIQRASNNATLPDEVRLLELLGLDLLTPAKLAARWEALPAARRIVLGAGSDGALAVEPAHAVIGGDADSGVSELVRAVVAGQAATNHIDELDIALVSAGPGNPLGACEDLPHVFEYVDASKDGQEGLDRLIRRLEYELDQREWPPDPEDGRTPRTPPRILLAVDNLVALSAEFPAFTESLAGLADRGRRFGLRIVIGASVIEPTSRDTYSAANTGRALVTALSAPVCLAADLRVAMYTANPEAVRLLLGPGAVVPAPGSGADLPGRGRAKLPNGVVVPFQSAEVSTPMASSATPSSRPTVRTQDWRELGEPLKAARARRMADDGGPTDLSLLVGALKKAAEG